MRKKLIAIIVLLLVSVALVFNLTQHRSSDFDLTDRDPVFVILNYDMSFGYDELDDLDLDIDDDLLDDETDLELDDEIEQELNEDLDFPEEPSEGTIKVFNQEFDLKSEETVQGVYRFHLIKEHRVQFIFSQDYYLDLIDEVLEVGTSDFSEFMYDNFSLMPNEKLFVKELYDEVDDKLSFTVVDNDNEIADIIFETYDYFSFTYKVDNNIYFVFEGENEMLHTFSLDSRRVSEIDNQEQLGTLQNILSPEIEYRLVSDDGIFVLDGEGSFTKYNRETFEQEATIKIDNYYELMSTGLYDRIIISTDDKIVVRQSENQLKIFDKNLELQQDIIISDIEIVSFYLHGDYLYYIVEEANMNRIHKYSLETSEITYLFEVEKTNDIAQILVI